MAEQSTITVRELIDQFLASLKLTATPKTYDWYALYLNQFREYAGDHIAAELRNSVVYAFIDKYYGHCTTNGQRGAARSVVRILNWGVEERLLSEKPLRGFRKPAETRREVMITPAQYALCLRAAGEKSQKKAAEAIKDVLKFLWHTGCRPQELRVIEAKHIDGPRIVLPLELSKGHRKKRVIYMDPFAKNIATRLSEKHPTGPIFRDSRGNRWTNRGLALAFMRLRKKTGIAGLCAYAMRHSFITRLLEKGVDVPTVAALAGHSPMMTLTAYNHVCQNDARLLGAIGYAA